MGWLPLEVEPRTLDMGVRATPSNLTMAIDLTKYEGHTEGPWESEEWDEGNDMKWILTFRVLDEYEKRTEYN